MREEYRGSLVKYHFPFFFNIQVLFPPLTTPLHINCVLSLCALDSARVCGDLSSLDPRVRSQWFSLALLRIVLVASSSRSIGVYSLLLSTSTGSSLSLFVYLFLSFSIILTHRQPTSSLLFSWSHSLPGKLLLVLSFSLSHPVLSRTLDRTEPRPKLVAAVAGAVCGGHQQRGHGGKGVRDKHEEPRAAARRIAEAAPRGGLWWGLSAVNHSW